MAIMNRNKINLIDSLQQALGLAKRRYKQQQFILTGDASTTEFALPQGWIATMVFNPSGSLLINGSAYDYIVSGNLIIFTIAPSADDFVVIGEEI